MGFKGDSMKLARRFLSCLLLACVLGSAAAADLASARPESVGMSSQRLARLSAEMKALTERGELPGVVTMVARKGKVVHFEAVGKRELEGGWFQWVAMPMPAVLTIQSGINQLRYATLKGIMAAKKKEIRTVAPAAPVRPRIEILSLRVPEKSKRIEMLAGTPEEAAATLVRRLRDEARVID